MNLERFVKYSVPFFVIAIISRSIEEISYFYYAVPVMCLFFIVQLLNSSKFKVQLINKNENPESDSQHPVSGIKSFSYIIHHPLSICLIPGLWFLLTSLWSSYPEVSSTRALYFILISTGSISAGFLWIHYSVRNLFDFLFPANVIVVLICLFSLFTNIPSDSWTGGHGKGFMGFFGHQNLLASLLLFTLPAVVPLKIKDISQKIKVRKVFFIFLLSLNLIMLILTYSRSAMLSLIFGVIVFLILNKNWKLLSYAFLTAAILTILIYFTPSLNHLADKIIKKDFPEFYSSRLWMWEPSFNAALEGGLFGLGYGISHPAIRSGEYSDRFENGRLIREKGNSVLALIEEAGLVGLVLFLMPILLTLILSVTKDLNQRRFFSRQNGIRLTIDHSQLTTHYSLLTAALAALILHAQFEAWWVGVGSVQLPLFFIFLGLATYQPSLNEIKT